MISSGHIIDSNDVDNMGATFNSDRLMIENNARAVSVQIKVNNTVSPSTGTAAGSLQLQTSNNGTTFINEGSSIAVVAATDSNTITHVTVGSRFLRIVYTRTSGNGIIDAWAHSNRANS